MAKCGPVNSAGPRMLEWAGPPEAILTKNEVVTRGGAEQT